MTATGFKCAQAGDLRDIATPTSRPDDAHESGATAQHEKEPTMSLQPRDFIGAAEVPQSLFGANWGPAARFKSFFADFLNALHRSRRLQADRFIHQNRHLVADV
jgi:hypothetical protein